jgi:hypothetical protein
VGCGQGRRSYNNLGVAFETARKVFDDPFAAEIIDDCEDYGESVGSYIGMPECQLL